MPLGFNSVQVYKCTGILVKDKRRKNKRRWALGVVRNDDIARGAPIVPRFFIRRSVGAPAAWFFYNGAPAAGYVTLAEGGSHAPESSLPLGLHMPERGSSCCRTCHTSRRGLPCPRCSNSQERGSSCCL